MKISCDFGTHKGVNPCPPKDSAGSKQPQPTETLSENASISDSTIILSPVVGTSLPLQGGSCSAMSRSSSFPNFPTTATRILNTNSDRNLINATSPSPTAHIEYPTPTLPKPVNFILQWNINGFLKSLGDLELLIHNSPPWCLALQEVNKVSVDQLNQSLRGQYEWVIKKGSNFRHSVAIGVLRTIPYESLNINTDLPVVGVRLQGSVNISIINVYFPCGAFPNFQNQVSSLLESTPEPVICLGDMNAHHTVWGGNRSDPRGIALLDLFEESDLVVLNDGSNTFFNGHNSTAIDVTAVSRSLLPKLQWRVNADLHGSDHHPIHIYISATPPAVTRRPKWLYERADWDIYDTSVCETLQVRNPCNITDFAELIRGAAEIAIPRTSNKHRRRALRWWTEETRVAVKARRKALRAVKRLPPNHPEKENALSRYRRLHIQCRQIISDAKRTSWEEFLDSMNASQTSAELWNRVNALSGKRKCTPISLQIQNQQVSDPDIVTDCLGEYFSGLSAIDTYDDIFKRRLNPSTSSVSNFHVPFDFRGTAINQPFSFQELQFALSSCKGKSTGPDGVGYPLLKNYLSPEK